MTKILHLRSKWGITLLLLLLICTFALLLRVIHLDILPVFADEAIYIRWSQIMAHEPTLRFLPLSDGKQPLYMWILMFLVYRMHDPLIMGRLVSVASGMGTLIGIGALSYLLFKSKKVMLVSCILWAIGPFAIFFDRLALVDSLLTLFGVWTCLLGVLTVKTKRWDMAMLTGFTLGGALLTKSPGLFFAILLPTTWLLSQIPKTRRAKATHLLRLTALLLVTYAIAFVMYNILRLGPNFQLIASRNNDYVYPLTHIFQNPLDPFRPHIIEAVNWLSTWGPSAVLLLYLGGLATLLIKSHFKIFVVLLAWSLLPIFVNAEFAKVFTARYILFCIPFFYIVAAAAFLQSNKKLVPIFILALLVFIIHSFYVDIKFLTDPATAPMPRSERSGYLEEWTSGIGIKEASKILINEHLKDPNQQIVVGTEGYFGTLPDGLQIYLQGVPNVVVIGIGLGINEVHPSLVAAKNAGNKTYLVANSSRLKFSQDFSEYGLKVVASYPKADRPNNIREYVQYGLHDTFYLFEVLSQEQKK